MSATRQVPRNDVNYETLKKSFVYILTNKNKTVLYIGVTSDLEKRITEHKTNKHKGFTSKYNCYYLMYFEEFSSIVQAIAREKQLKAGNRKQKEKLIHSMNPEWKELCV